MPKLIKCWKDLEGLESENYKIHLEYLTPTSRLSRTFCSLCKTSRALKSSLKKRCWKELTKQLSWYNSKS